MRQENALPAPTTKSIALLASGAIVLLAGSAVIVRSILAPSDRFAACSGGQVAGGSIGGPFTLVDQTGATVTDAEVFTKPSVLYFGYTFCPDVCPLDTMRNAQAVEILDERGIEATPVFITVDPARDTPEVLAGYAENFHDRMIGLTGTEEQVAAASQAYRTYYRKQDGDSDYYLVDHSTFSYLVLPDIGFVEFFRRDTTAEAMADTVACYVDALG
jgi:protein SCO1